LVREQQNRDGFITQGRILVESLGDGRAAVLTVVDDEVCLLEVHFERAYPVSAIDRLEVHFTLVGGGDGRKQVSVFVLGDIARDFRNALTVEDTLLTVFGPELNPVLEREHLWDCAE